MPIDLIWRVPRRGGGSPAEPADAQTRLVPADSLIREYWDGTVQPAIDDARVTTSNGPNQVRPDFGWRWSPVLSVSALHGNVPAAAAAAIAFGQRPSALALAVEGRDRAATVALSLVCGAFPFDGADVSFIWFLSTAPAEVTARELGFEVRRVGTAMMYALVGWALARRSGTDEEVVLLLHASPQGGEELMHFYESLGMVGAAQPTISRTRKNDGRYLFFSRRAAQAFLEREREVFHGRL